MISPEEIRKLAALSRIAIKDEEVSQFTKEIESILNYVGTINTVNAEGIEPSYVVQSVMREDGTPHEPELFTDAILREAPERKDGYVQVKKILGS